ncbi:MAG: LysM peptidoglycan-binding domain-containing protein [Bacillota bacterium]|nr:LysM peptidoglycan-binding domain-containing protein [Bacillota bacterium]
MLIHVVQSGETLYNIAARYQVPYEQLIEVNGLPNPNQLVVGEALLIPSYGRLYTVREGDSLWGIAQQNGTTVQAILRYNPAGSATIYPGQILYIPAPRHIVRPGENLSTIAQQYGVSVQSIIDANNIKNPNFILPGTMLIIPFSDKPAIDVNGYIYIEGEAAVPSVNEVGEYLTYLSPFAYLIKEDGSLQPFDDMPAIDAAVSKNAVPMMAITNFTSTSVGENLAHIVLTTPQIVNNLLDNIITVMQEKGYKGVNIDFENVLPEDREAYNNFLQTTVDRLHPLGYFVSTALAPKTSANQPGSLYEAHDYAAHGRIVDFVVLMTYEWGYRKGPPQAISPINQIRRVLDYAVTVIPRDKILLGFQIYARDWLLPHVAGQEAETFSVQEALDRAYRYGATIQYDQTSQSPFYNYTDEQGRMHEVWFEDPRSAQAKFDTIKEYNLRGVSYWALGFPFPQNWSLLNSTFTTNKNPQFPFET